MRIPLAPILLLNVLLLLSSQANPTTCQTATTESIGPTARLHWLVPALALQTQVSKLNQSFGGPDINLGSLNVHLDGTVTSKSGRGIPFSYLPGYSDSVWHPERVSGLQSWPLSSWPFRFQ